MGNNITAHRDGQTRQFTAKQWDVMGFGKCGWSAAPEVPREVVQTVFLETRGGIIEVDPKANPFVIKPAQPEMPPIKTRKKRRK